MATNQDGYASQRRLKVLVLIFALIMGAIMGITVAALYQVSYRQQLDRLAELVEDHSLLIEATVGAGAAATGNAVRGADTPNIFGTAIEIFQQHSTLPPSAALLLVYRMDGGLRFLNSRTETGAPSRALSPDAELAEPMRRALAGMKGVSRHRDFDGKKVAAVYAPLASLNAGLVATVEIATIRAPFVNAALWSGFAALLLILLGIALFVRINRSMVKELATTVERLNESQRVANLGNWEWDIANDAMWASDQVAHIYGVGVEQFHPGIETVQEAIHVEDRENVREATIAALHGEKPLEYEHRITRSDGVERILRIRGDVTFDRDDAPIFMRGTVQDVTGERAAEESRTQLERQLLQAQKMEAIGAFAGGMAHDFNNILSVIMSSSEMALAGTQSARGRIQLERIQQASNQAKNLIKQILSFSRKNPTEHRPVVLQDALREIIQLLRATLPHAIEVVEHLEAPDVVIIADENQIDQVVMNIAANAAQAMPEGGQLSFHLEVIAEPPPQLAHSNDAAPSYLRFAISDTGCGMDAATRARVFEPFFTTKTATQGTGLGLSIAHGIIADHGGVIEVESQVNEGTCFTIFLPVAANQETMTFAVPEARSFAELPRGAGAVVLYVDDDPMLIEIGEELIAELGYEPVAFSNSRAALQAFQEDPDRFDIVLTDQSMPHLTGVQLAAEIKRIRPDIPIILITGYMEEFASDDPLPADIVRVLRKPVTVAELADALGALVARVSAGD